MKHKFSALKYSASALSLLLLNTAPADADAIRITSVSPGGKTATITGDGFGGTCGTCEVIVNYGSLRHAFKVRQWTDNRITVTIPDLGLSTNVKVFVKTKTGISNGVPYRINPVIIADTKIFKKQSRLKVGNKGEERYRVNGPAVKCGQTGFVFDSAKLKITDNRFGDARIISQPRPDSTNNQPLIVRWYHEPTGRIAFQVQIFKRKVQGVCQNMLR